MELRNVAGLLGKQYTLIPSKVKGKDEEGPLHLRLTSYPSGGMLRLYVYPRRQRPAGTFARDAGPADPAHVDLWIAARPRDCSRDSRNVRRRAAGGTRGALSRAAAAGRARLDFGQVGNFAEQSQGAILFADVRGTRTTGEGNDEMEAAGGSHRTDSGIRSGRGLSPCSDASEK